jgi:hypothetical protein
LDEGLAGGSEDPKWAIWLSAVGWIMREEDGEVDDEFPHMLFLFFLLI